jgi:diguanylate cyclase (GGDEF)-like protein
VDKLSKNDNCMNRWIRFWGLLLIFLGFMVGSAAAASLDGTWYWRNDYEADSGDKDAEWVASAMNQTDDWQPFSFSKQESFGRDVTRVWLMTTLPKDSFRDAALFMQVTGQSFDVWLDDTLIYSYGDLQPHLVSYGQRWHVILLPPDYEGRKLIIRTYASDPSYLGRFESIQLDSNVNQMTRIIRQDLPYTANIPLSIFMILMMALYFSSPVAPRRLYTAIIIFIVVFLLWMVCASNTKQLLLDAPAFWWILMRVLVYVLPISANYILFLIVDKEYKRGTWMTVLAFGMLLFIALWAEILGLNGLDGCASAYYIMLPALELLVLYWVVRSALGGNGYCRAVLIPLIGLASAGTIDGFAMHFHWLQEEGYMLPYATITAGIFLLYIVRQQIKRERYLMARAAGLEDEVARAVEKAEIDALTQCYNRNKMDAVLAAEVRAHRRDDEAFSLIMMDIDFFKRINDTFGHEAGDEVLAGFAAVVRRNIKKQDVFVRWGGEEFILVCRRCSGKEAALVAERLRHQVECAALFANEPITCSVGVASWHGTNDSITQLLKRVDDAMYEAKRAGRNRVCQEQDSVVRWFQQMKSE